MPRQYKREFLFEILHEAFLEEARRVVQLVDFPHQHIGDLLGHLLPGRLVLLKRLGVHR